MVITMNLYKTSFWAALSTTYKILAGLITTKIMAVYVGPAGIALLGNFGNITSILTTFANGAITSGVTKYIAEFDEEEQKNSIVSHAIRINLICSIILGAFILLLHNYLAQLTFGDNQFGNIFIILGFTIIFYGLNTTASAILNGYKQIKYLIITGMIASTISLILAIVITIRFGLFGALVNTMFAQVLISFVYFIFIKKLKLIEYSQLYFELDRKLLWKLFKYATMSIVSALVGPMSLFIIRSHIFSTFSPNEAGFVQGVWMISAAYLSIITTTLSIYYLPTLSSIKDAAGIRQEIIKGYKFLLPIAIISGIAIFICRDLIIYVLYSPVFQPMKQYFTFQIIGDVLKIGSFILSYLMVAKAMTRWFITTEIVFSFSYVGLTFFFTSVYGSIGVTYAYAVNYLIYWIFLAVLLHGYLVEKSKAAV